MQTIHVGDQCIAHDVDCCWSVRSLDRSHTEYEQITNRILQDWACDATLCNQRCLCVEFSKCFNELPSVHRLCAEAIRGRSSQARYRSDFFR